MSTESGKKAWLTRSINQYKKIRLKAVEEEVRILERIFKKLLEIKRV